MTLLEARDLTVRYGGAVGLAGINLTIAAGEIFAVIGESGCGKSTLGRTLLMLQRPSAGRVLFQGEDISALGPRALRLRRRAMQMIFQDPYASLNARMTIGETLAEPLVMHGLASWRSARPQVATLLRTVGLDPAMAARYPHAFSGGQRQRIAIARAVITGPALVVADEPLSALDMTVQGQILALFRQLQAERGLTYLFISHDLPVVRHFADRVAVMLGGHIVEQGRPARMFATAAHPYTRALLDAVPIPDPARARARLALPPPATAERASGAGCPFVARCPVAMPICGSAMPKLRALAQDHSAACWLHGEAA